MEYQIEPELVQRLPRSVQPSMGAAGLGCITLFFVPFVGIGISALISSVKAIADVVSQGSEHLSTNLLGLGLCLLWAGGWNGALGYMFYHATKKARKDYLLARYGTPVPATILSRSVVEQNDSRYCVFTYQFTLTENNARTVRGEQKVDKKVGNAVDVGDTMTVLYLPQQTDRNSLYQFMGFRVKGGKANTYSLGRKEEPVAPPIKVTQSLVGNYVMEPELQQPRPRQLAHTPLVSGKGLGCIVLFCVPFVLIGIYTILLAISLTLVSTVGVSTKATVMTKDSSSDDGVKLVYTFSHAGATYQSADRVLYNQYERINSGDTVNIRYLSFFPHGTTLLTEISATSIGEKWFFTLLWNGLLSLFLLLPYYAVRSQKRYAQMGIATPVVITAKTVDRSGENDIYQLHYRHLASSMGTQEGTERVVGKSQWDSVSEGEVLTLLSLPNALQKQRLYRFLTYKACFPNKAR